MALSIVFIQTHLIHLRFVLSQETCQDSLCNAVVDRSLYRFLSLTTPGIFSNFGDKFRIILENLALIHQPPVEPLVNVEHDRLQFQFGILLPSEIKIRQP